MRCSDLSGTDQPAALSGPHAARSRANLPHFEKNSRGHEFNFSQSGSRNNCRGKSMSWEQSTADEGLARVDSLENSLQFTTTTRDSSVETLWDSAAAHKAAKRIYDLFFSTLGLVLLSPFLLLIGLVIKLSDRGPIFYRQKRIGQYGIPFLIWKFRTMVPNADAYGPAVTSNDDPRVTPLGRLLRRTKIDELPQLWNVLCGEMSLVGPRPEVARFVEHYTREQRAILQHKPGITDLASLRFRNEEALLNGSATA